MKFTPNPASDALYTRGPGRCMPARGERGRVTSVSFGRTSKTCLPGPGGGLVYVKWDGGCQTGVSTIDIVRGRAALNGASPQRRRRRK